VFFHDLVKIDFKYSPKEALKIQTTHVTIKYGNEIKNNKWGKKYSNFEYTQLSNLFFAVLHTLLALLLVIIEANHKSITVMTITLYSLKLSFLQFNQMWTSSSSNIIIINNRITWWLKVRIVDKIDVATARQRLGKLSQDNGSAHNRRTVGSYAFCTACNKAT
jgi:hypothetical protein